MQVNNLSNKKVLVEAQEEAQKIAKGTQRPGQTKEQTKLIAKGIEKGIAEYKKQQKVKSRDRDKTRKKELKAKQPLVEGSEGRSEKSALNWFNIIPWFLLAASWVYFAVYPLA